MICRGDEERPKVWHLEPPWRANCLAGQRTARREECQEAVDYILVTQNPDQAPGGSLTAGNDKGCGDKSWGQVVHGCSIDTVWQPHFKEYGDPMGDMGSGAICQPNGGYQLVCSGESQEEDVSLKNYEETVDQYRDYCSIVTAAKDSDLPYDDYCAEEPLRLGNLAEPDRKSFVRQQACTKYRKCIAGIGDKWFHDDNQDCTDTVSPCYWDDQAQECYAGIGYAERSALIRDAPPIVYYWNYHTWDQTHQENLRKTSRTDYIGELEPTYSYNELKVIRETGDGRSRKANQAIAKEDPTYSAHFGHCHVLFDLRALRNAERKLLAFKDVLEEYDPEKRRARELLWGAAGDGVSAAIDKAIDLATYPINYAVDLANNIAEAATDVADAATSVAKKAMSAIKSVKDKAVELANKVAELPMMIWDSIYSIVPTSFKLKTSGLADLPGFGFDAMADGMGCPNPSSICEFINDTATFPFEATVCNSEADCFPDPDPATEKEDPFCVTVDQDLCPRFLIQTDKIDGADEKAWAKPCLCASLRKPGEVEGSYPFHCNYASGFCQAGYTPFRAPISSCEAEGGLVYGSNGYNSLCYIAPLWKCANERDVDACRRQMGFHLQGPSLCRAFCAPKWENRNNRLADYTYQDGSHTCVCEVGVDRAYPELASVEGVRTSVAVPLNLDTAPPPHAPGPYTPPPSPTRRSLLGEGGTSNRTFSDAYADGPYTVCSKAKHCSPSFDTPTICRSLWDTPVTCYSCSERVHGKNRTSSGYACSAETKKCECTAPVIIDPEDERSLPDDTEWRGDSWCDNIMRAYRFQAVRSPLENAWVTKCSRLRLFGVGLNNWLGLQTVPPDMFYNPSRIMWVGMDVAEGVYEYFNGGWDDVESAPQAFFDRLVELRVDPILTFKFLDWGQQFMFITTSIISKLDPVGMMTGVIDVVHPEAAEHFTRAKNASSFMYDTMVEKFKKKNITQTVLQVLNVTLSPIYNFTTIAYDAHFGDRFPDQNVSDADNRTTVDENGTAIVLSAQKPYNESTVPAVYFEAFESTSAQARHLLAAITTGCGLLDTMLTRLVVIANTLAEYYGSADGFLYYSLCAYNIYLTDMFETDSQSSTGGCPREGQTVLKSEWSTLTEIPGLKAASVGFSSGGFSPASLGQATGDFFGKPNRQMIKDTVAFTATWATAPVACDKDMLLCKNKKRSLLSSIWITEVWLAIVLMTATLMGFPVYAIFFTSQLFVVPAVVMYLTYGFPFTCLPSLPVCIGDDAFDLLVLLLPRHLTWPAHIVPFPMRSGIPEFVWFQALNSEVVDCKSVDVNGMYDVFYWSRQYTREMGFIEYDLFWQVVEWPLLRFAPGTRAARTRWRIVTLSPLINECAAMNVLSIFPPIIISFFFYLIVSFAAMPLLRLAANVYVQSHPLARKFVSLALDIYNT